MAAEAVLSIKWRGNVHVFFIPPPPPIITYEIILKQLFTSGSVTIVNKNLERVTVPRNLQKFGTIILYVNPT